MRPGRRIGSETRGRRKVGPRPSSFVLRRGGGRASGTQYSPVPGRHHHYVPAQRAVIMVNGVGRNKCLCRGLVAGKQTPASSYSSTRTPGPTRSGLAHAPAQGLAGTGAPPWGGRWGARELWLTAARTCPSTALSGHLGGPCTDPVPGCVMGSLLTCVSLKSCSDTSKERGPCVSPRVGCFQLNRMAQQTPLQETNPPHPYEAQQGSRKFQMGDSRRAGDGQTV